jgi:hypothetical protein
MLALCFHVLAYFIKRCFDLALNRLQAGLRLDAIILSKITFIAKKNKRSLNAQIEFLVQEFVEEYEGKHGAIPLDPEEE